MCVNDWQDCKFSLSKYRSVLHSSYQFYVLRTLSCQFSRRHKALAMCVCVPSDPELSKGSAKEVRDDL